MGGGQTTKSSTIQNGINTILWCDGTVLKLVTPPADPLDASKNFKQCIHDNIMNTYAPTIGPDPNAWEPQVNAAWALVEQEAARGGFGTTAKHDKEEK